MSLTWFELHRDELLANPNTNYVRWSRSIGKTEYMLDQFKSMLYPVLAHNPYKIKHLMPKYTDFRAWYWADQPNRVRHDGKWWRRL